MRFVVYGAGAIGGVVGARLFQQGHEVVLIARGAHHDGLRDRGYGSRIPPASSSCRYPWWTIQPRSDGAARTSLSSR
jgi:2-dehydropantoate 2-reductase